MAGMKKGKTITNKSYDKKKFSRTADRIHVKNSVSFRNRMVYRGGFRL